MSNFVVGTLNSGKQASGRSVGTKRVRNGAGKIVSVHTVDVASRTLSEDLTFVFGRNVGRARRENKRVLGVTDVAPAK